MNEDVVAPLVVERFGRLSTPPPERVPEPDSSEAIQRRQRVLAGMPGDEWPGEEAA